MYGRENVNRLAPKRVPASFKLFNSTLADLTELVEVGEFIGPPAVRQAARLYGPRAVAFAWQMDYFP